MEKDFNIFDGKNFSDLSKEIYDNSKLKSVIPFELTNIKESITTNCKLYLEDNN